MPDIGRRFGSSPILWKLYSDMGLAMSGKHDVQSAIAEFREALKIGSSYRWSAFPDLATVLLEEQRTLTKLGAECREALKLEADYTQDAHFGLGDVFLKKGKLDDAAAGVQESRRERSKMSLRAHIKLGQLFLMREQIDRAISELNPRHAVRA